MLRKLRRSLVNAPRTPLGAAISSGGLRRRLARQVAEPDQERDERVEHDQRLPEVKVEPLEPGLIPLAEIEEADDADEIEGLDRNR